MPTLGIVEAKVSGQGAGAIARAAVGLGIRPLVEQRANEAFGLAVGLGPVGPGEVVANLEPAAAGPERVAPVVAPVVRQQPPDRNDVGGVPRVHAFEEADGRRALFVGEHLGVAHAGAIIDGDVDVLPADAAHARRAVAVHPVAHAPDLPQLLHVEMHQGAGAAALVALDGARRLEARQTIEPVASEKRHHGAHREGVVLGDAQRAPALPPAAQDLPPLMPGELPRQAPRARRAIRERLRPTVPRGFGAAGPLPQRLARDARPPRHVRRTLPVVDPLHREGSPARRASCILVDVH